MNSKSDIANELIAIKNKTKEEMVDNNTIRIKELLEKNIKSIEDNINSRIINIYERPWKKLEKKLKFNKINEYSTQNDIKDSDIVYIKKYFMDKKKISIEYDEKKCLIENITY